MRADNVVPFAVPGIARDREVFHLPVADLDAGRVLGGVELGGDGQPGGCCGGADQVDDRLVAGQGPAAPVPGDLGEQAVLDFVRPVKAIDRPKPIIARPPVPPTSSSRRGDRANQVLTELAGSMRCPKAGRSRTTPGSAAASEPGRARPERLTNSGNTTANKTTAFGFATPTTNPFSTAFCCLHCAGGEAKADTSPHRY